MVWFLFAHFSSHLIPGTLLIFLRDTGSPAAFLDRGKRHRKSIDHQVYYRASFLSIGSLTYQTTCCFDLDSKEPSRYTETPCSGKLNCSTEQTLPPLAPTACTRLTPFGFMTLACPLMVHSFVSWNCSTKGPTTKRPLLAQNQLSHPVEQPDRFKAELGWSGSVRGSILGDHIFSGLTYCVSSATHPLLPVSLKMPWGSVEKLHVIV